MKGIFAVIQSVYRNDKAKYLRQSISSILMQSYSDFIYYIGIDGFISDDLRNVLSSFDDDRIRIVENKENKGLAGILNDLLSVVMKGHYEYIARMDSDDIALPDRFEKQVRFLEAHPNVDVVGGAIHEIDEKGESRHHVVHYPCSPSQCHAFFSKRNPLAHPTVMFRRRYFEKTNCFYPTDFIRNEDTRLWHEGYKHGCVIANIHDVVLYFRTTDDMFKQRRNGNSFAKSQLQLRKLIIKDLNYGRMAYVYAYAMYLLMISPSWILKTAYKFLR